ncbi:MAG TPA: ATP-binding cassette domain-containing protein [Caulobacteraceae bacterium]|nr:ATP-binding cassette domain-containing protein [Caulobacteraceae bacterium]
MDLALDLDGVTKRYGGFVAVRDLSFHVKRGAILGFLGPNGAGKTTTLRMILGLISPSAGKVAVLGEPQGARLRAKIGFLPEERGLYRRMTAVSAIAFFASLKGMSMGEARRKARRLLEDNGLGEAADRPIRALSKGMAQKVQLLSAIAHDPELVILDEPFSGLDPVNQQSLEGIIQGLAKQGATVVFSTHVMQHAERLCDQVVLIANGTKMFDGAVAEACAAAPRKLVLEGALGPEALCGAPGVAGVVAELLDDGRMRLTAELAPGAPVQAALKAAFARDLDISRLELKEPHLHDAFIALTGGQVDLQAVAGA